MCGIALICGRGDCDSATACDNDQNDNGVASPGLLAALHARGPDFLGAHNVMVPGGECRLHFIASLLQLRGRQPGTSPCLSSRGHILCFNGEVFGGLEVAAGENDGACLLQALVAAVAESDPLSVPRVISRLRGPWALLFWDPGQQRLWVGRDVLGRRSLLVHFPDAAEPRLMFSSVSELPGEVQSPPPPPPAAPASIAVSFPAGASAMSREGGTRAASLTAAGDMISSGAAGVSQTAAAAAAASGGGGGSGDGGGADGEDPEPSGCDGYWTELPPGLYSISFASASELPSLPPPRPEVPESQPSADAPADASALPAASVHALHPAWSSAAGADGVSAWGSGRTPAGGQRQPDGTPVGPFRRLTVGARQLVLERHAWLDPLLLHLERYRRPESAPARQQQQQPGSSLELAEAEAKAAVVVPVVVAVPDGAAGGGAPLPPLHADAAAVPDGAVEQREAVRVGRELIYGGPNAAPGAAVGPPGAAVGHGAEAGTGVGDGAGVAEALAELPDCLMAAAAPGPRAGAGAGPASPPPSCWAVLAHSVCCPAAAVAEEELAHVLLTALLAAMRVRCGCIETRSPHPSASYAAAALRAATATSAATGPAPQPSWRRQDPHSSFCRTANASSPLGVNATATANDGRVGDDPWVTFGAVGHGAVGAAGASAGPCGAGRPMGQQQGSELSPHAPVMILFSGGVDSVLLAALAHRVLPPGVPIDLSNVCFAGGCGAPSPDREAARDALEELAAACPGREWRLVEVDATLEDVDRHRARLLALLRPARTVMDLNIGAALWLAAAGQGTLRLPAAAAAAATAEATPAVAAPGLTTASCDATHNAPPPSSLSVGGPPSRQPDAELHSAAGAAVAVLHAPVASQDGRVSPVSPTCMHSLATPVAAAAAPVAAPAAGSLYGSAARVVLLGHGADEQCGGYGRHRTRFRSGGWAGLAGELEVDVRRLWLRNLGRDDRLMADWGREGRHPFLDEEVMRVLLTAQLDSILDPLLPPGQGDKRVLRRALQLLGLPRAAARVKRAIQFGSRIGKVSNVRDFGSNRAANKKNAGGVALQDVEAAAVSAAAEAWVKPRKGK